MIQRVTNPKRDRAHRYIERGITVCDRWRVYENFLADMGRRPSPKHSLDRIDTDGNYEPGNCRWATNVEQANHMSRNRMLTHNGRTMSMADWERATGVSQKTIKSRLAMGWSVDRALTEAPRKKSPSTHRKTP